MAVKKPASVPARDKPLVLQLRCCYYIPRSKVAVVSAELCKIFKTWLPFTPNWLCEAIQDWKLDDEKAEKVFVPLLFNFTNEKRPKDKSDVDLYEDMWKLIGDVFRNAKTKKKLDLDKHDQPLCWGLHDVNAVRSGGTKSRWILPLPTEPIDMPAEKIEQVLYNLIHIKQRLPDGNRHKDCGVRCFSDCLDSQLFREQKEYKELSKLLDDVYGDAKPTTVKDVTSALENVDKTLQTVVNLMTLWVDPKSILRPIKGKLFTNIHNAVARWTLRLSILTWVQKADRKKVRDLCQALSRELAAMQRVTPLLAGHVRLSTNNHWQTLKQVCASAPTTTERTEMTSKMSIDPARLSQTTFRDANFRRVRTLYVERHEKVAALAEQLRRLMVQGLGPAESGTHTRLFAKSWAVRMREARDEHGAPRRCACGIEDVIAAEKLGTDAESISDSDTQSGNEKLEEKWVV